MKSSQSSIYRAIENVLFWALEVSNRVPKSAAFSAMSARLMNEYTDALTTCSMALRQPNLEARMELIDLIIVHLDAAASVIRVWHQWSSRKGLKAGECSARILTDKQLTFYFSEMEKIGRQLSGWKGATSKAIAESQQTAKKVEV